MKPVTLIDAQLIESVSAQAASSPRRRKNFNFHETESAPANRLLNAMEPDSYVRPHRHLDPAKDETLFVLRGSMGLVMFDDDGKVLDRSVLRATGDKIGVNLPSGTWHTFVSLEAGSVIFEAKAGPYHPLTEKEKAPWAPAEGDPAAVAYLDKLADLFRGDLAD